MKWTTLLLVAAACGGHPRTFNNGDGGDDGGPGGDNGTIDDEGGPAGALVVTPATIELDVTSGAAIPTQAFTVTSNGADVTSKVSWSFGRPEMGDVLMGSTFTPTGKVGGVGVLAASIGKAHGEATVTIKIKQIVSGLSPQQRAALDAPSSTPDPASIVYPTNDTFFPRGVLGPEVQWSGAGANDAYRLEIKETYYDYVEYFSAPSSHALAEQDWDSVAASAAGAKSDPLTVTLGRLSNGVAYKPMQQSWHVAAGNMRGVVYYWQLDGGFGTQTPGQIVRLDPGMGKPTSFFSPPAQWNTNSQCWGCHSISHDGRQMIASFYDYRGQVAFSTIDLTKNAPGKITPSTGVFGVFGAYNDKGDKILVSNENRTYNNASANTASIDIIDANTGKVLVADAFPGGCAEPAWSPDGKHISATCKLSCGSWSWDCPQAELWTADVNGNTVSNVKPAVQSGQSGRPYFGSFSPDSQYIAFAEQPTGLQWGNESVLSDLWLTDLSGKQIKRLHQAMGGTQTTTANISGNPRFAPLRGGGYSWIVFMSRRNYGNELVGQNRPQLWVAAIDDPPTAADPSHPAFLLRGQDLTKFNMRAEVALPPCKNVGEGCASGSDCCGGQCVKGGGGKYVCGMPQNCSASGNACTTAADCCDPGATCTDGYCALPVPK